MRIAVFAAGIISLASMASPSHADPYQWCAIYGGDFGGGSQNCYFVTLDQCQQTLSGLGGLCRRNPYYTGPEGSEKRATDSRRSPLSKQQQ